VGESLNALWSRALAEELVRSGVRHAVICPGSRSTPLALAFAEAPGLRVWSVIDERQAAFFALGIGRQSGAPAVVLATSGTAGAHFLPAAIEAAESRIPMLLVTADRPIELHGWGAPQQISQGELYGRFARWSAELGIPEARDDTLLHLRATASRAAATARSTPKGPVHLNAPFREPLAPPEEPEPLPELSPLALQGRGSAPFTELAAPQRLASPQALDRVRERLQRSGRGLVYLGPHDLEDGLAEAAIELGRASGYPVLAEAASNARFGRSGEVIALYDALLRHEPFARAHRPEVVLRFGGGATPKAPQQWLDSSGAFTVQFCDGGALVDPSHCASMVVEGDAIDACRRLAQGLSRGRTAYAASFASAEARARAALEDAFAKDGSLSEPRIAREVARALVPGANLFVSSSMPIRDLDGFALEAPRCRVFANRGANGIDGILSTALGVSASSGRPTALLTGDLAFLHDLGALVLAARSRLPLAIVVVHNDGGGIFEFLPVARRTPHFEALFATPHGLELRHAAALVGAPHLACRAPAELYGAVRAALEGGLHLIEVKSERPKNVRAHQELLSRVAAALGEGPWD